MSIRAAVVGLLGVGTLISGGAALAGHGDQGPAYRLEQIGVVADAAGPQPLATVMTAPVGEASQLPRPAPRWLHRISGRTGVGVAALAAYAAADLRLQEEQPGCALSWVTLAGVGYVESRNGTIGNRTLGPDGRPGPTPILGVALDGAGQVARIGDTDRGMWDGDAVLDRAVGPMQFLPSTWRTWGSDGDGDGVADPQDIDDAAHAAARYLCASGGRLDTAASWTGAVLSYNRSATYVRDVLAAASAYAARSAG